MESKVSKPSILVEPVAEDMSSLSGSSDSSDDELNENPVVVKSKRISEEQEGNK